jgi:carbon starvation protein
MLLAPRDNISTYLKIGTVVLLAVGILFAQPVVRMPAVSRFVDGSGPVFGGGLFPFCFIVIACGAISGFHSLISSGVTPRFIDKESDMRTVAYGAMLTESFVGVMALVAAVTLVPGVYMAITMPAKAGETPVQLTARITQFGEAYAVTPEAMAERAAGVQEKSLYNRSGGGPTLAMGMAQIFSGTLGKGLLPFWYHFAIMFEAVFILTVLDSGTRVIRFVIHELFHDFAALRAGPEAPARSFPVWITSLLAVVGWGLILLWGILDQEGGTKALIKMFGTANQLLSVIALTLATVVMLKQHRRYAWVTALPLLVVGTTTLSAAFLTIFSGDPRVGQVAAMRIAATPAALTNARLTTFLTGMLIAFTLSVLVVSFRQVVTLWRTPEPVLDARR